MTAPFVPHPPADSADRLSLRGAPNVSILASSLTLGSADYEWRDGAICRDTDPELFFPVGTTGNRAGADRPSQGSVRRVRRGPGLPRLRARHEPGLRDLGWPDRGRAARDPSPPRRRLPRQPRRLNSTGRRVSRPDPVDPSSVVGRHAEADHGAVTRARAFAEAGRLEVVGRSPSGSRSVRSVRSSRASARSTARVRSPASRSNDGSTPRPLSITRMSSLLSWLASSTTTSPPRPPSGNP